MGGIANGLAYHGGFLPYVGTFLTFSDYMRGSVRLASVAGLPVMYVWTHDSVGLGEDGPTHQPVEHYAALRAIPNLWFVRPGDANETVAAWALALERRDGPVALALTRQKLPTLPETATAARAGVARGGYVLRDAAGGAPQLIMIGTGSELQLASPPPRPSRPKGSRRGSCRCRAGSASTRRTRRTGTRSCRRRAQAGQRRGRRLPGLGALGRRRRRDHRARSLRRVGAGRHDLRALRVHRGARDDVARRVVRDGLRGRIGTVDGGHFGNHPTIGAGQAGVDRSGGSDPGHS